MVPIAGTSKRHRLEENIASADIVLAPEHLAEIERAASAITIHGARYVERLQPQVDR